MEDSSLVLKWKFNVWAVDDVSIMSTTRLFNGKETCKPFEKISNSSTSYPFFLERCLLPRAKGGNLKWKFSCWATDDASIINSNIFYWRLENSACKPSAIIRKSPQIISWFGVVFWTQIDDYTRNGLTRLLHLTSPQMIIMAVRQFHVTPGHH